MCASLSLFPALTSTPINTTLGLMFIILSDVPVIDFWTTSVANQDNIQISTFWLVHTDETDTDMTLFGLFAQLSQCLLNYLRQKYVGWKEHKYFRSH